MSDYAGLTIKSVERFDNLGRTVSSVGDVNNDGFDDVLVLSRYYDRPSGTGAGAVDPESGLSAEFSAVGTFVTALGDINGDGVDDFSVAGNSRNYYGDGPSASASFVYVIYGDENLGPSLSLAGLDGSNGFSVAGIDGRVENLSAGDLNGDGTQDLVISQSAASPFGPPILLSTEVLGDAPIAPVALSLAPEVDYSGFVLFGDSSLTNGSSGASASVLDIDGTNGFAIQTVPGGGGGYYGEYGGYGGGGSIRAIGDVNGDGIDDLFVTENSDQGDFPRDLELPPPGEGQAAQYIVFGSANPGESIDPRAVVTAGGDGVLQVDYEQLGGYSSAPSLTGIGDINGDGIDDIAVSDPNRITIPPGGEISEPRGVVHVLYGSADGPAAQLSLDGPTSVDEGFSLFTSANGSDFARFGSVVAGVGDVNGDGIDDMLIASPNADFGERDTPTFEADVGEVQLVFGNSAGFDLSTDIASLTQSEANAFGYRFIGDDAFSQTGQSISAAGDVNGDGFADFIIGAPFADNESLADGGDRAGEAYLVYGGAAALEAVDNADGTDDNIIDVANLDVNVLTGEVPTTVDVASLGFVPGLERDGGETTTISITLRRDGDLSRDVSVDFNVAGSGLRPANADDFGGALPSGTVSFAAGADTATVDVIVSGDNDIEVNEDFSVTISNVVGSGAAPINIGNATGFGRILTDDVPPAIFVAGGGRVVENDTTIDFTINREGDDSDGVVVNYSLLPFPSEGSFFAADSNDIDGTLPDFTGSVTFAAGEMSKTVTVNIVEDNIIEPRESFELRVTEVTVPDGLPPYAVTTANRIGTILNDDGRPNVIPPGIESDVFGDPHLVTLDGLAYDFQATGEYVLIETATPDDPNGFQVQVRFEAFEGSELVSVTTRMAVQLGANTVEIDASAENPLIINGQPGVLDADGNIDLDDDGIADVLSDNGDYFIRLNNLGEDGEFLKVGVADGLINVCVFLETAANGGHEGDVQGLMGNGNGDSSDEFSLRDGSIIPPNEIIDNDGTPRLSFDFLYGRNGFENGGFADSWSVGTERFFSDPAPSFSAGFPVASISLDDLPPSVRAVAEQAALDAGLDPELNGEAIFEAAVLDYALTGDSQFFDIALSLAADAPVAETTPFGGPVLPATYGILADATAVVEGDSDSQIVNFIVFRAGDDTTTATFTYDVSGIGEDDYGPGETGTGTVVFSAGETVKTITISVAGDTTNEDDEPISVSLSTSDDVLFASTSATTSLLTDDFAPIVVNAPVAGETDEDTNFTLDVSNVFVDLDGDAITVSATAGGGATASVSGGILTVTPIANFVGAVPVTLVADDGNRGTTEVQFTATFLQVNDAPTVINPIDQQNTDEDVAFEFEVPNDTFEDVDGDALEYRVLLADDAPMGTTATIDGLTITVTPPANFNGPIGVIVTADDGVAAPAEASFVLSVTPTNDAPILVTPLLDQTGTEDTEFSLTIPAGTFDDIDGDDLTLSAVPGPDAPEGTIVQIEGDVVTVMPPADFNGDIAIVVSASDGQETASSTFTLAVAAVNDEPVVAAAIADQSIAEDQGLSLSLDGVFTDVDDDMLELSVSAPAGLTAEIIDGTLSVAAPENVNGVFDVTVTATDDEGASVDDTFTLTIVAENDAPIVANDIQPQSNDEDAPFVFDIPAGTFEDIDGDTITLSVGLATSAPAGATASINGRTVTVTPPVNFNGDIDVIVTASDGIESVDAPFTLTVDPVNDAPDAVDDSGFSVDEGASVVISAADLLANDTDVDSASLSIASVGTATNGSVALNGDGDVVFTADGGATGPASFEYTLSDGELSDTAVVSLTVDEVSSDPYADYEQGTEGRDFLFGSLFSSNQIFGAGGNDLIFGGFADDALAGGDGKDKLLGFFGDDLLEGNAGNDRLYGGWGDDDVRGGSGKDWLYGSRGQDRLEGGTGKDYLHGGSGQDTFVFNEGDDRDVITDFSFGYSFWGWWGVSGDKIELDVEGVETFEDVINAASQSGRNTVFDFGDGDKLIVRNTRLSQYDEDDFLIL